MSKQIQISRRAHPSAQQMTINPADLRRLRQRLHAGAHVVLQPQDVQTVLQMVAVMTPAEPATSAARRVKPSYQRQQHRPVRK